MRECDNRKIHISSNFLLSSNIYTAKLRYISQHFTKLHFTTLIDTSLPLIYTSLLSHLA